MKEPHRGREVKDRVGEPGKGRPSRESSGCCSSSRRNRWTRPWGGARYECRDRVEAPPGYRNGFGDLGRRGNGLPGGRRATVLEPSPPERTRRCSRRGKPRPVLLTKITDGETGADAEHIKRGFPTWTTNHGVAAAGRRLDEDSERLATFYAFPKEHGTSRRTTNVVESPFASTWRTRRPSPRKRCWSRTSASVGWTRLSCYGRSARASSKSTVREKRGNEKAAA